MRRLLLAAALGALLPHAALAASTQDYRNCDGAAGGTMSGLTMLGVLFGPPGYGNTASTAISEDANVAITSCNAALAELDAKSWMRKVSLLRARAIHKMALQDGAGAKADLDLAEAAGQPGDAFYERSMGWGLAITRAYWMIRNGDRPGGEALAMQTLARRPWNRQTIVSAMAALGDGASDQDRDTILRDLGRLMPSRISLLYIEAYDKRRYDEVLALYDSLAPNLDVGSQRDEAEAATVRWNNERRSRQFAGLTGGIRAYALAATGKPAEARAAIAALREDLTRATEPPPPLPEKDAKDREKVAIHDGDVQNRRRIADEEGKLLDSWSQEVELRIAVGEGRTGEVMAALAAGTLLRDSASLELLDAAMEKLPADQRPPQPLAADLRAALAKRDRPYAFKDIPPRAMLTGLPEAESRRQLTPWEPVSFAFFGPADEGFSATKPAADGSITVSFRGDQTSTGSMVEEMTLLRAAEMARQAGKKGFLVLDRKDVRNSVVTTYMGQAMRTDPNGYRCTQTVLFVDAPPKAAEGAPWRVLDADAIYAELAPIYIPQKQGK